MTNALRITVLCVCAGLTAAAQTDGEWTANRIPGHTKVWSAERSSQEVARVAAYTNRADTALQPETTNGWEVGAHSAWITNETDAAALAALATNRVTRWYASETNWAVRSGQTITEYALVVTGITYTISGDCRDPDNNVIDPPHGTFPFTNEVVVGVFVTNVPQIAATGMWRAQSDQETYPITLFPVEEAYGTILLEASYATNSTVYYLQTNLVPNETWSRTDMDSWQMTNVWVSQTWGAAGTNAHYTMTWDITNGTWSVREVIP